MANLEVTFCGKKFKNPVIAASGTFGFGREYAEVYDISALGGIATKGITLKRREGNSPPRIAETYGGILNSVGLQNPGVREFLGKELGFLKSHGTVVIVNIAGSTEGEYCEMARLISRSEADMIELNISCPNVKEGGLTFGSRPESIESITRLVKASMEGDMPLIVKLSPNVASISEVAVAAEEGGADAVSLINTITGMAVDVRTRRPVLANITGGLSGPCIKPIALRMVYEAYRAVKIPIIGMGGIMTAEDAVEFMLCGASLVQVGTANLIRLDACKRIIEGLEKYCLENGIKDISELTGSLITE